MIPDWIVPPRDSNLLNKKFIFDRGQKSTGDSPIQLQLRAVQGELQSLKYSSRKFSFYLMSRNSGRGGSILNSRPSKLPTRLLKGVKEFYRQTQSDNVTHPLFLQAALLLLATSDDCGGDLTENVWKYEQCHTFCLEMHSSVVSRFWGYYYCYYSKHSSCITSKNAERREIMHFRIHRLLHSYFNCCYFS